MTFSIVGRCRETGMFGMAISSSSPAVAARCAHARAGLGVVASQNVTDPRLGPWALDLMQGGASASDAVATLRRDGVHMDYRQVLALGTKGAGAIHSGRQVLGTWAEDAAPDALAAGNLLANDAVPAAMTAAFAASTGHLAARLLAALNAGLTAGGEAGPVHSAGLVVVDRQSWPLVDLRIDWSEDCPIARLAAAWAVYQPQVDAYVTRALDPREAPSYGVPGDE